MWSLRIFGNIQNVQPINLCRLCGSSSSGLIKNWSSSTTNILIRTDKRWKSKEAEVSGGSTTGDGFQDLDKPIKFTTSKAAEWKAQSTHGGSANPDMPWIQTYSVCLSVGVFLLYFLALREENDVDERMKVPLWERIPGLERQQLELVLQYNTDHGLPTADIRQRLNEINSPDYDFKTNKDKNKN